MHRDPRCVFVADSLAQAEVVAVWLREQGIAAQVMNPATLGGLVGLTVWSSTGISSSGLEVWALEANEVERARELLQQQEQFRQREAEQGENRPVTVICSECGDATTFAADKRGSVQNCTHCDTYLDVPTEGEEWDVGEPEPESSEDETADDN